MFGQRRAGLGKPARSSPGGRGQIAVPAGASEAMKSAFQSAHKARFGFMDETKPLVIEAALREGREAGAAVLIEATCNQVNQDGGYTGMTPVDFRRFVEGIADRVGFAREGLILGGDHLGPNPWKHLPADEAMAKARVMMAAFVFSP